LPHTSFSASFPLSLVELQSIDSTNNYARRLIEEDLASEGQAIFSLEQTAGKGQRGRAWESEKGQNIILSLIVKPYPLQVSASFLLSAMVSVSVNYFFSGYAGSDTNIKWPNDLYWQDRKAGGILIESIIQPQDANSSPVWKWAIIGIGININQAYFDKSLPNPVSLKQITGKQHDPKKLSMELATVILKNYQLLKESGPADFINKYNAALYKKNEKARFKKDNRNFEGIIKSVTANGKLVVQHAIEEEFEFGEIEWIK
jgi:BirA family transcriptional regulator, biotin operon repressor / biotin---[acetyl-CoA-carboxylase] ligase